MIAIKTEVVGNELVIRLPIKAAEAAGVVVGANCVATFSDGRISIRQATKSSLEMAESAESLFSKHDSALRKMGPG